MAEARRSARTNIVVRGARQHNLKNVDLDLPRNALIVFTGLSGSGKSSLAFDTIYAEGQRRYVESLSAYARQFLERMDKPDADLITGLAPAIAIEQKTTSKNPRSTVATQTELYDHLRLLFARVGTTVSPVSDQPVTRDSPRSVASSLEELLPDGTRFFLTFPFPDHHKSDLESELRTLTARGFGRLLVVPTESQRKKGKSEEVIDLTTADLASLRVSKKRLRVLVDRLAIRAGDEGNQSRIADSVDQSFREGGGRCTVTIPGGESLSFSEHFERDGMRFAEPSPHMFSFNSPVGACPTCQGFGSVPGIDPDLVIPNPDLTIRQGAIAPFRSEKWQKYFRELVRSAVASNFDIDKPFSALSDSERDWIWNGSGDYPGINGFFAYLQKRSYKMHYRIYNARFRGFSSCPDCKGYRLRPEALYVQVGGMHIGEICELTTLDAREFFEQLELTPFQEEIAGRILEEIRKRLRYLVEVGLDYLTLDRLSHTLSGGESQRINLSTSLGSSLVGSLYVLDEPSIGLHPRDTDRLIRILEHLRDIGNTVIVVEHEPEMMRRSDRIVDLGPGSGRHGGAVIFDGDYDRLVKSDASVTGAYLSGRKTVGVPESRRSPDPEYVIRVENAREHNLKRLDVSFPLGMIVCVTGVSGSGKSTLVDTTLYRGLQRLKGLHDGADRVGTHSAIRGHALVSRVEMVDQRPIGKSPRSNPVTYVKAFGTIRDLFAETYQARVRGYRPGYFSFNVPGGRCEVCQGEGVVKIEMQFLADLYLECEACKGKRYKQDVLEITYNGKNIDDVLALTVDEAVEFFSDVTTVKKKLDVLQDIGLGYLTLGQPSNTLSGGEAQRIKLATQLGQQNRESTLYIFDEPTTGLHFDDIRKLMGAFQSLVESGDSVIIVEHNLEVIKSADWIIDLGPEGGRRGGFVVGEGSPEMISTLSTSHTGAFLREALRVPA
jgi:excinuclease ABC subunit A